MSGKTKQVNLNIDELKGLLTHVLDNNRFLQKQGKKPVAVEVIGESGIGKTSAVLQLADQHKLHVVKLNLAQIEELGDLVGFPVRQFQLCKAGEQAPVDTDDLKPDVCIWVDEQAVDEYVHRGFRFTGEKRMSYCPPEWIAGKEKGGYLILDDWNRADIRFIQAVMELVDRQEYISWKLPQDWHIILTANPDDGQYLVQSIDVAQKTRFVSANLKFDIEPWARWAEAEGIDGRCINFLLKHPEMVTTGTNPRSITTFFNCISSIKDFSDKDSAALIQLVGEGSVGPEFTTMFNTFIQNKLDKLIAPHEVLFNPNDEHVLGELRSCIGRGKDYRADIAALMTTRIINYGLHHAESKPIDQKCIDRIIKLCTQDILMNDLKYIIPKKLLSGNKQKFQKLMVDSDVQKMVMK